MGESRPEQTIARLCLLDTESRFAGLVALGYQGSKPTVRRHMAKIRKLKRLQPALIPLDHDPGESIEVDWGVAVVVPRRRRGHGPDPVCPLALQFRAEMQAHGRSNREFIEILMLHRTYSLSEVSTALERALAQRTACYTAVKQLLGTQPGLAVGAPPPPGNWPAFGSSNPRWPSITGS